MCEDVTSFKFLSVCSSAYYNTGNHPWEELAKFGYRSERKVEKFKNPAIFWQPAGICCINMVTLALFFSPESFVRAALKFFWVTNLQYFASLKRCRNCSTTFAITFHICQSMMNFTIPIFWWGGCSLSLSHTCHRSPSDLFAMLNICWTQSLWSADMFYNDFFGDWPAGGTKPAWPTFLHYQSFRLHQSSEWS